MKRIIILLVFLLIPCVCSAKAIIIHKGLKIDKHNFVVPTLNMYEVDEYKLKEGFVIFEYLGIVYSISGDITIKEEKKNAG